MTVAELKAALARLHPELDEWEVKVWLPGSTIRLTGKPFMLARDPGLLLIEGNVDPIARWTGGWT